MEFTGKVIFFDEQETKKGDGYNLTFVVENVETFRGREYKTSVKVEFYQKKGISGPLNKFTLAVKDIGATVKVQFDPEAEEYNGKYYQRNRGYNIELIKNSPAWEANLDEMGKNYPGVDMEAYHRQEEANAQAYAVQQEAKKGDAPF